MNAERILIASECIGDAKYFIDKAKSYATIEKFLEDQLEKINLYNFL